MNGHWLIPGVPGVMVELSPGPLSLDSVRSVQVVPVTKPKKRKRKRSKR